MLQCKTLKKTVGILAIAIGISCGAVAAASEDPAPAPDNNASAAEKPAEKREKPVNPERSLFDDLNDPAVKSKNAVQTVKIPLCRCVFLHGYLRKVLLSLPPPAPHLQCEEPAVCEPRPVLYRGFLVRLPHYTTAALVFQQIKGRFLHPASPPVAGWFTEFP